MTTNNLAGLPEWVLGFKDHDGVPAWVYVLRDRVANLELNMENLMTQEADLQAGFDELTQTLAAVADDVKAKIAEIVTLEEQLASLQATTSVDLSAAIAQAKAIRESLEGTAAAASGEPAPVETPVDTAPVETPVVDETAPVADEPAPVVDETAPVADDGSQTADATA